MLSCARRFLQRRYRNMANIHHGEKVGGAAKKLASNSTSNSMKSKAGKILANHKVKYH